MLGIVGSVDGSVVAEVVGRTALGESSSRGIPSQDIPSRGSLLASPGNSLLHLLCHAALMSIQVKAACIPHGKEGQEVHSSPRHHSAGSGPGLGNSDGGDFPDGGVEAGGGTPLPSSSSSSPPSGSSSQSSASPSQSCSCLPRCPISSHTFSCFLSTSPSPSTSHGFSILSDSLMPSLL